MRSIMYLSIALCTSIPIMCSELKTEWIEHLHKHFATKKSESFETKDKQGQPLILEWSQTDMASPEYVKKIADVIDLQVRINVPLNMASLRAHPEMAEIAPRYKGRLTKFFKQGPDHVDWDAVQKVVEQITREGCTPNSNAMSSEKQEKNSKIIHIMITAKTKDTKTPVGCVEFIIEPYYIFGDINCAYIGIDPDARNRGIATLLANSLLKIVPSTQRVEMRTRDTNKLMQLYAKAKHGFSLCKNPRCIDHVDEYNTKNWHYYEYFVNQKDLKRAKGLQDVA